MPQLAGNYPTAGNGRQNAQAGYAARGVNRPAMSAPRTSSSGASMSTPVGAYANRPQPPRMAPGQGWSGNTQPVQRQPVQGGYAGPGQIPANRGWSGSAHQGQVQPPQGWNGRSTQMPPNQGWNGYVQPYGGQSIPVMAPAQPAAPMITGPAAVAPAPYPGVATAPSTGAAGQTSPGFQLSDLTGLLSSIFQTQAGSAANTQVPVVQNPYGAPAGYYAPSAPAVPYGWPTSPGASYPLPAYPGTNVAAPATPYAPYGTPNPAGQIAPVAMIGSNPITQPWTYSPATGTWVPSSPAPAPSDPATSQQLTALVMELQALLAKLNGH